MPKGPPMEILVTELIFFLIVFGLCTLIYFKTKGIYQLSKHKGIFHFRNVFIFFALAYLFRLIFVIIALALEFMDIAFPRSVGFWILPGVSFFSTMAILSMVVAVLIKRLERIKWLPYWIVAIGFLSSLITFVTRSHRELLFVQTLVFLIAIIIVFWQSKKAHSHHLLTQNNVTYLLLFVFWILSVLAFNRKLIPVEFKIPLYILSAAVFFWIYWRVQKRLNANAKTR